jgi:hypothetical protein
MSQNLQRHQELKKAALLAIKESQDLSSLAEDVLTNVVIETIHKYQKKLNVGIQDSVSDLLDNFKHKITDSIFNLATNWRVANRDYILFPAGCRFCYTKGKNTIVVIEQEPQVRSLLFDGCMVKDKLSCVSGSSERMPLALPYVVFVIHFSKNSFASMYFGWRNAPLRSLDDMLFRPIMPNIHDTLAVCMGKTGIEEEGNIAATTESILSYFWNSQFNNDLSDYWWKKGNIDSRLKSAQIWSENSIKDSSFILTIQQRDIKSVKSIIQLLTLHENEPDETQLRQQLSENIDKCVEALFAKILRYFKNTKFDKYHPKDVSETLLKVLQNSNSELLDMVFIITTELEKISKQIEDSKNCLKFENRGGLWSDYS